MDAQAADPLEQAWSGQQIAVLEALRTWTVGFGELNQRMATWMRLPTSDSNALGQIVWAAQGAEPLSPARLARRIGMTTGATTVLLNRLEESGLVVRSREHRDRRRVTLRPTDAALDAARRFTAEASTEIAAALHEAPAAELVAAEALLGRMNAAVVVANDRLAERMTTDGPLRPPTH